MVATARLVWGASSLGASCAPLFSHRRAQQPASSAYLSHRRRRGVDCDAQRQEHGAVVPSPAQAAPQPSSSSSSSSAAAAGALALPLLLAEPALALALHPEPANALSLPTWAVHTSSVIEWAAAMGLIWRYGEVSGVPQFKGLTWAMLPCFFSAMCACTWHFFFNSPDLQLLVVLQAALTLLGNTTCCWAAYRIYRAVSQEQKA